MKTHKIFLLHYYFLITLLTLANHSFAQSIYINEFMASNSTTIKDPDYNDYADWIELFNDEAYDVNLKNYYITDNLSQPMKYKFQNDLIIPRKGYLIIWADDRAIGNHTNFKLSASGESIGLYNPSGNIIDSLNFSVQLNDISEGRFPDGTSARYKFKPSTPGSINLESSIFNRITTPTISQRGGFYNSSILLTITHTDSDCIIKYTLDGSTPSIVSETYINPLQIDTTTVVRFRALKEGFVPSSIETETYFINENTELPVFSLVTDPENFFSDTSGIYVIGTNGIIGHCSTAPRNWNQDWERPINIQLFETNREEGFKVDAGVKIYGGCTRLYAMKSLAFYFRNVYGDGKLNYRLFPNISVAEYNNFILRSSGQDWWRTMFRDGMVQTILKQGMNIDYQEYRPSVVFLNGRYWGIHNIREKLNEHYTFYRHGVDAENIDLIEISKNVNATSGDAIAYNNMITFLSTKNMSMQVNYDYIKSIVDIDEYIDYQIAQIYSANGDWPGSNMKLWRPRTTNSKWRWMIYDLDFTFGGNSQGLATTNTLEQATALNGPSWPNPPWSTLMLRKLLDNVEFKNEFIQRFAAHMNTTFEPNHVVSVIDSLADVIAPEIPRHKERWEQSISMGSNWLTNIQVMKDFAFNRPSNMITHIKTKFNLQGTVQLIINSNNAHYGVIYTNGVKIKQLSISNLYFKNIPIKLKAVAMPGYRFVKWEGVSSSDNANLSITLQSDGNIKAIFEEDNLSNTNVTINEINYKSSEVFDTEDWVELYNPLNLPIDISGWKLRDGNNSNLFVIPSNTIIEGKGYFVLCRDSAKFSALHYITNVKGNIPFGFSSEGETVRVFNSDDELIDYVTYLPGSDWPTSPNGGGPTLALINPELNNANPSSWKASALHGTPGKINDVYTKIELQNESISPTEFGLKQNFPNPFNPTTRISYSVPFYDLVNIKIFDVLGNLVEELINEHKNPGDYLVEFNASNLSSGIYFCRMFTPGYSSVIKMIFVK